MTPEEARALEPGTTPGPWEAYDPGDGTARLYAGEGDDSRLLLHNVDSDPHTACVYVTREDGNLIAAAPDMRATIAALRWGYGAQCDNCNRLIWRVRREDAENLAASMSRAYPECSYRLVRRLVGPAEVAE